MRRLAAARDARLQRQMETATAIREAVKPKASTFLIFIVSDPDGLTRHRELLPVRTKFAVKRTSSRVHVDRWLTEGRIRFVHPTPGTCGVCGCTDQNCAGCIARTGQPCHWLDPERTVCSACYGPQEGGPR